MFILILLHIIIILVIKKSVQAMSIFILQSILQ